MTEFKPGTSPPPVRMPIRFADMKILLQEYACGLESPFYRRRTRHRLTGCTHAPILDHDMRASCWLVLRRNHVATARGSNLTQVPTRKRNAPCFRQLEDRDPQNGYHSPRRQLALTLAR